MSEDYSSGEPPDAKAKRLVAAALSSGRNSTLPKVVASGYGHVAEEILALAFANGVKVREDGDLASLLAALDLDSEIPLEVLHTVSEILARVYEANGRLSQTDDNNQNDNNTNQG